MPNHKIYASVLLRGLGGRGTSERTDQTGPQPSPWPAAWSTCPKPPPPCPAPTCACAPRPRERGARARGPVPHPPGSSTTYFSLQTLCPGDLSPASVLPGVSARPAFQPAVVPRRVPGLCACAPGRHQRQTARAFPGASLSPPPRARPPRDRAVAATARAQLQ